MKNLPIMFILLLLTPSLCYAYVGPGVGLTVITSLLALGSAFFITVLGFIWLPIKRFFKGESEEDDSTDEGEDATDEMNDAAEDEDRSDDQNNDKKGNKKEDGR